VTEITEIKLSSIDEEDAIGKPAQQRTSDAPVDNRELERRSLDSFEQGRRFGEEPEPEPRLLILVPRYGLVEVRRGSRLDE
jgi:hypothetical protein